MANEIKVYAVFSFKGKSTDTKPTDEYNNVVIENGSSFYEMDTQDLYMYDGTTWIKQ